MKTEPLFLRPELSENTDSSIGSHVHPIIGEILDRHFPDALRNQARRHMVVTVKAVDLAEEVSRKAWMENGNQHGLPSVRETAKMAIEVKKKIAAKIAEVTAESDARIAKNLELLKP